MVSHPSEYYLADVFNSNYDQLCKVQTQIDDINEEAHEKVVELDEKYCKILKPFYVRRNEMISSIPDFWLTTFTNHRELEFFDDDQELFKYLESLNVEDFEEFRKGYVIKFKFKPNPFFENTEVTKTIDTITGMITGTVIKWKEGMGPDDDFGKGEKGKEKRPIYLHRFFSWFDEHTKLLENDMLASLIKVDLWTHPLKYFNKKDEDDDPYDEEDEDYEEIELGRAKKLRTDGAEGCDESENNEMLLHIKKLEEVQNEIEKVFCEGKEEMLAVQQKSYELTKPLFAKRNEIISRIPDFWSTTFRGHPHLGPLLNEEDHKVLKYLESLNLEALEEFRRGYRIIFRFVPNPYFEDTELIKEIDIIDEWITGFGIKWKSGKGKDGPLPEKSFFRWFNDDGIFYDEDEEAMPIKFDIWPNPLQCFDDGIMAEVRMLDERKLAELTKQTQKLERKHKLAQSSSSCSSPALVDGVDGGLGQRRHVSYEEYQSTKAQLEKLTDAYLQVKNILARLAPDMPLLDIPVFPSKNSSNSEVGLSFGESSSSSDDGSD